MKRYQYKIQWLFGTDKLGIKNLKTMLDIIGVKSLDKICLRDFDYKIVDTYTSFVMYPDGVAESETMKYIRKEIKKNPKINSIELLRK